MKLKPYIAATLLVVGSAAAAATSHKEASYDSAQDSPNVKQLAQGNSVVPMNGFVDIGHLGGTKKAHSSTKEAAYDEPDTGLTLKAGMMAGVNTYFSSAYQNTAGVVDYQDYSAKDKGFSDIYLRNANLFMAADFGIVHPVLNLGFNNYGTKGFWGTSTTPTGGWSNAGIDEAYVDMYSQGHPLYAKIGRQYINYGDYNVYAVLPTLTQQLTQASGTGAMIGGAMQFGGHSVLSGSITGFSGGGTFTTNMHHGRNIGNFSAKIGFEHMLDANDTDLALDVSYLHDLNSLSYYQGNSNPSFGNAVGAAYTHSRFGGDASLHAGGVNPTNRNHKGLALGAIDVHAHAGMGADSNIVKGLSLDVDFTSFMGKAYTSDRLSNVKSVWAMSADAKYQVAGLNLSILRSTGLLLGGGLTSDGAGYNTGNNNTLVGMGLPGAEIHVGLAANVMKYLNTTLVYQFNAKPKGNAVKGTFVDKDSHLVLMNIGVDV